MFWCESKSVEESGVWSGGCTCTRTAFLVASLSLKRRFSVPVCIGEAPKLQLGCTVTTFLRSHLPAACQSLHVWFENRLDLGKDSRFRLVRFGAGSESQGAAWRKVARCDGLEPLVNYRSRQGKALVPQARTRASRQTPRS